MTTIFEKRLTTGTISVSGMSGNHAEQLFDIAERRNPKRAFLFVSKVLGRHIPVSPDVIADTYRQLGEQLTNLVEPVLFVGMAETAVGLAAGVYREASRQLEQSVLITSTRHPVDGELLCEFKENHSHATDHLIYLPMDEQLRQWATKANTIVLIDDEATTGNTFANLLQALLAAGIQTPEQIVTVTLTDWSSNALAKQVDIPVTSVSLLSGEYKWQGDPTATQPFMPDVNVTAKGSVAISGQQSWGRLGMDKHCVSGFGLDFSANPQEKVLVLGSGEFVWEPFLLAERLKREGADVLFSATTRSPISLGHAIESALYFGDNYGLGIPNYLYNVANQFFDRILLCVETPASSVDPLLLEKLAVISPEVQVVTHAADTLALPVALVDLDDTLFNTKRKMVSELGQKPYAIGALDRSLQPRSFMTKEQSMLTQWLLNTTMLIPVTARGTEEMSRVKIPFTSWQSLTHGAVILQPNGEIDPEWQAIIEQDIAPYQETLLSLQQEMTALFAEHNIDGWARINYEYGRPIYLVMKHCDSTKLHELDIIAEALNGKLEKGQWYVHRNSNNIALLPICISKGRSVEYLLKKLHAQYGQFPVLGLGDSLTDMSFLGLCDWFGMPRNSQLSKPLSKFMDNGGNQ
ncbi:hypothetical protein D3C87_347450 [compost metagenome]